MTNRKKKPDTAFVADAMMYGKVPPQAKELEEAVLGEIMLDARAFDLVCGLLTAESFYVEAHQLIYRAMCRLQQRSHPVDMLTVCEELKNADELEKVGGPYYITVLTGKVVSSNPEYYARIIHEKFIKREIIRIGGESIAQAFEESADAFEVLNACDKRISELSNAGNSGNVSPITEGLMKSVARIDELRKLDSRITGIPSGFMSVDMVTHGWQNTDLIIIAARPSVGKTAFALNVTINAAKLKVPVAFFSLEMSKMQLINRALSSESEIYLDNIMTGKLDDEQMKVLHDKAIGPISNLNLFIDDTAAINIFELRAKCRRLKNKHKIGLIVIDYLQLMSGTNEQRNANRESEIAKISRDLKGLAKELQVPIIALSQLSRETEKRKGDLKMPQLSDLRESGAIEQDADLVMFLYRPEYYDVNANESGESTAGETHLKIAKHRSGKLETVKLTAKLGIQKFVDGLVNEIPKSLPSGGKWKPVLSNEELF